MEKADCELSDALTLDSVRESLIRQEDTIVFSLIERAKFRINSRVYDESFVRASDFCGSLAGYVVKKTEAVQAQGGRYESPEEQPFFPENLPPSLLPPRNYSLVLRPAADSININQTIWNIYFKQLLPLFAAEGDDGNYASTAACDLTCLQALSRRIHFGKFVAKVKFKDAPEHYKPAIHARDRDALMNLLTFKDVEDMVVRRVEKKAMEFGQEVSLNDEGSGGKYKVDPSVVGHLYREWIMPLTKHVQVEYLLCCLD